MKTEEYLVYAMKEENQEFIDNLNQIQIVVTDKILSLPKEERKMPQLPIVRKLVDHYLTNASQINFGLEKS